MEEHETHGEKVWSDLLEAKKQSEPTVDLAVDDDPG